MVTSTTVALVILLWLPLILNFLSPGITTVFCCLYLGTIAKLSQAFQQEFAHEVQICCCFVHFKTYMQNLYAFFFDLLISPSVMFLKFIYVAPSFLLLLSFPLYFHSLFDHSILNRYLECPDEQYSYMHSYICLLVNKHKS